jgi:hydroxymethylpyrimidine/phosphomethylpyrimidine kinase
MKTALTIAGSDSSGGAGIQADLKTFAAHGVYGMSVITSVTSQNTKGVYDVFDIPPQNVASQADAVFSDIFPDSVKIGMVSSAEIIKSISDKLKLYNAKNVVLDTVMVSTSGCPLLKSDAVNYLTSLLFPLAKIITPNLYEAQILCGFDIKSEDDMVNAAEEIFKKYSVCTLLKGGHLANTSNDLLFDGHVTWFKGEKIDNPNTHGTGCTLSSAIAANLAIGYDLKTAVKNAKAYISGALSDMLDLGSGSGPLNHMYTFYPNIKQNTKK